MLRRLVVIMAGPGRQLLRFYSQITENCLHLAPELCCENWELESRLWNPLGKIAQKPCPTELGNLLQDTKGTGPSASSGFQRISRRKKTLHPDGKKINKKNSRRWDNDAALRARHHRRPHQSPGRPICRGAGRALQAGRADSGPGPVRPCGRLSRRSPPAGPPPGAGFKCGTVRRLWCFPALRQPLSWLRHSARRGSWRTATILTSTWRRWVGATGRSGAENMHHSEIQNKSESYRRAIGENESPLLLAGGARVAMREAQCRDGCPQPAASSPGSRESVG